MNRPAVFLDRDGVINPLSGFREGKPRAPDTVEDFTYFPGVPEAIRLLKDAGFLLIVVTNQPDVARGWQTLERVDEIHEKLRRDLPVDDIFACFHTENHDCDCRKPRPGMLEEAARKWKISLEESFMVGDRASDIEAGSSAGCKTVWIESDPRLMAAEPRPDFRASSLLEAARWILQIFRERASRPG